MIIVFFSDCAYLAAYKRIAAPTQTHELLAKVHSLCRLFVASKGGMQCEADDFFNRLQCKIDSRRSHLANPGLAATRMWSTESSSLEERPHEITLSVASDNTTEPESLPLSPWC